MRRLSLCQHMIQVSLWFLFFALPYFVDVAYCEDLSPSHFAQAVLGDGEEIDPSEAKDCASFADDPIAHIGSRCVLWKADLRWHFCRTRTSVSPQCLLPALLTSRPPPIP